MKRDAILYVVNKNPDEQQSSQLLLLGRAQKSQQSNFHPDSKKRRGKLEVIVSIFQFTG